MPVAAKVFLAEPRADAMAALVQQAIRSNGAVPCQNPSGG
jgi:hypothetical protein